MLSTLILDKNDLQDEGVKELANCLTDRFAAINSDQFSNTIWMPLIHLSISDVQMTDNSFKYLMQRFENIH